MNSNTEKPSDFAATRWTLVLRAQGKSAEARSALSELCEAYYQPVLRFLWREGRNEDAARERTQEFFSRILSGGGFDGADPARGRFRSYLLGALKHFLSDLRERERRQKRGGGVEPDSLDSCAGSDPAHLEIADGSASFDDTHFDRQWALTVMDRALLSLRGEFTDSGKLEQFEALKPWLAGDTERLSQAGAAARLGWTESALKVAVHRLRKRFREAVRREIGQTVGVGADIDVELRYLIEVLGRE